MSDSIFGPFARIEFNVCGLPGVFNELLDTILKSVVAEASLNTCCSEI